MNETEREGSEEIEMDKYKSKRLIYCRKNVRKTFPPSLPSLIVFSSLVFWFFFYPSEISMKSYNKNETHKMIITKSNKCGIDQNVACARSVLRDSVVSAIGTARRHFVYSDSSGHSILRWN